VTPLGYDEHMFDVGMVEFEALDSALDSLVEVDPVTMSDGELHRALMELMRQQSRLAAVTLKLASSWDTRGTWAENGSKSAAARLAREAKVRRATAAQMLKRAKALASMPHTAAALADGAITVDHVDLLILANAHDRWRSVRFVIDEEELVGYCKRMSLYDADREIRYWINRVDAELGDDGREPAYLDRELSTGRGIGNEVHVRAILDPVGGGEFLEALDRIEQDLYLDDKRTGNVRTDSQRRADALIEMARRAMAAPADAKQPRPLISVVCGDWSFRRLCELSDGTIVGPNDLVPHISVADVEAVLFDGPLHGIGVSHKRTFTGALRRLIEIRDRHCQHPSGCDVPMSKCDVDHIEPYRRCQLTTQEGGRLECRAHNRDSSLHDRGPGNLTIFDDDPIVLLARRRLDDLTRRTQASPAASAAHRN
jgi:Domain of unknown function (DUF222)